MEIHHDLYQLLDEMSVDMDLADSFQRASLQPPITHESLSELDIARIVNNPKLRHDVNFDKELHFRPNLDGSRGKTKLRSADEYWKALIGELELYRAIATQAVTCDTPHDQEYWTRMMITCQKRMPGMFETIRDVLKTLVPERDQATVSERLDVTMIMQQISKGVFDLMSLAQWLAKLLKAHCAPMRDDWIDQMVAQTEKGVQEGCQKRIVIGLRQLLGILEAMKLVSLSAGRISAEAVLMPNLQDVANHQIRHLRGLLIEDAINFQQRYHMHRLQLGRLNVTHARRWFEREQREQQLQSMPVDSTEDRLKTFLSAFLRLIMFKSSLTSAPETFSLDVDRLRALRSDLHNLICLDICSDVFNQLVRKDLPQTARDVLEINLRNSIGDLVGESRRFTENVGSIAVEIVRLVLQAEGTAASSDADMVELAEQKLRNNLHSTSMAFEHRSSIIMDAQLPKLYESVKSHLRLTSMALHQVMVVPTVVAAALGKDVKPHTEQQMMAEIIKRITHMAVLHWHIWSPMVYLPQEGAPKASPTLLTGSDTESADQTGGSDTDSDRSVAIHSSASTPMSSPTPEHASEVVGYPNNQPSDIMSDPPNE